MDTKQKSLFLRYCPYIYRDKNDPFPVRLIGCTAFWQPRRSDSFPKWYIDPQAEGAAVILEYAIYYDYDIQHLYDLEHIWVAVDDAGRLVDCWCSFHGMRLRAAAISTFTVEGEHPVLYAQPGKHAMLPHPELFQLHPDLYKACCEAAGGGVLVPAFLSDKINSDIRMDEKVTQYIRDRFAFIPTMEFVLEKIEEEQFVSCEELFEEIPNLIMCQLSIICKN